MTVPDFQSLMLPVLLCARDGEVRGGDVIETLANQLNLSEEDRNSLLPSGKQTRFANRVHWARGYLKQAGLIEATKRGYFKITDRGKEVLQQSPARIDIGFLNRFPDFQEFRRRTNAPLDTMVSAGASNSSQIELETPDETIRTAWGSLNSSLAQEILDRIRRAPPAFFERVIVALLIGMGYGGSSEEAGRAIGKAGDDGVDGVIDQDPLGLDRVYVQAKRYQQDNHIGPGAIRDFFGSLDMHKASKGLFVCTSGFTAAAAQTAERLGKRIVLIDGSELARLMIRYGVGCRIEETLEIKRLDEEFFDG